MKIKPKKCRNCYNTFMPSFSSLQIACSPICASELAKEKRVCDQVKEMKEKLKTHKDYLNILQAVFNTFIRERDKGEPCISCNRPLINKFDAGHYFSVGSTPSLRFNEDNVHGQCVFCNQHHHGNMAYYAINLPKRIGLQRFQELHELKEKHNKLSIDEIKEKIIEYKQKTKSLKLKG